MDLFTLKALDSYGRGVEVTSIFLCSFLPTIKQPLEQKKARTGDF